MIPDFKTYIKESVWGDIYKRGAGEQIRKEDDVNLLDGLEFIDYLNEHYKITIGKTPTTVDFYSRVSTNNEEFYIKVPILSDDSTYYNLFYYINAKKVFFLNYIKYECIRKNYPTLFNSLCVDFQVEEWEYDDDSQGGYIISPNDGTDVNNKFFLDVLDYIIENGGKDVVIKKKKINNIQESVWGDIYKRGAGEQVRKEDDINHMDKDAFFEYLKEHYKVDDNYQSNDMFLYKDTIHIPCFTKNKKWKSSPYFITMITSEMMITVGSFIKKEFPDIFETLGKEFDVWKTNGKYYVFEIYPKDGGEVNNSFCLKVLDFIIDNTDENKLILQKK